MKKLLSFLFISLLLLTTIPTVSAAALTDVLITNSNYDAIHFLYDRGIIEGYDDGTFKPTIEVSRAELAKILVGGTGVLPDETQYKNCFPDVKEDWYAKYVCYAKEMGWVEGYLSGEYMPGEYVKRTEAIKMVINSQGFTPIESDEYVFDDVDNSQWYAKYLRVAKSKGLLEITSGIYGVSEDTQRGEISENIYRSMVVREQQLTAFVDVYSGLSIDLEGPYKVTNVVDGDTVDVLIDGEEVRLRLIGIDTPETVHPSKPVECYGPEASNKVKAELLNQNVYLEADLSQDERDKYDRLLRYIVLENGVNYNKLLIEEGYAFESTYNSNPYEYQYAFIEAQKVAREEQAGLWAENACEVSETQNPVLPVSTGSTDGHVFYASSYARTKYYCDTDPAWEELSKDNLIEFANHQEVLDWVDEVGKILELNQGC